jgi:hypothetical protein
MLVKPSSRPCHARLFPVALPASAIVDEPAAEGGLAAPRLSRARSFWQSGATRLKSGNQGLGSRQPGARGLQSAIWLRFLGQQGPDA